jgi:uncharacterized protein YjbI with pentapeptide repeats
MRYRRILNKSHEGWEKFPISSIADRCSWLMAPGMKSTLAQNVRGASPITERVKKMPHAPRCRTHGVLWPFLFVGSCAYASMASSVGAVLPRSEVEQRIAHANGDRLDLGNLDLSGLDLSGLHLAKADFFSSNLAGADLSGAELTGANFTRTDLRHAKFSRTSLRGVILYAGRLEECDFSDADLALAQIIGGGPRAPCKKAKHVGADLGADPANQGMVPPDPLRREDLECFPSARHPGCG